MSYSFSVRAESKAAACAMVADKLREVLASQPVHEADQGQALGTAETFIGLLETDETKDVAVSMNGSIWKADTGVRSASVTVGASLVDKEVNTGTTEHQLRERAAWNGNVKG